MSTTRRDFIKRAGAVAGIVSVPVFPKEKGPFPGCADLEGPAPEPSASEQNLHIDFRSNLPGTECFFIGNGMITAALQSASESGTHCGLFVMSPEHFGRRASTFLFHPERGVEHTRLTVATKEGSFVPSYGKSKVVWEYPLGIPTIVVEWEAGGCLVREELYCPIKDPALIRHVTVTNRSGSPADIGIIPRLYPNLMLFDEYQVDRSRFTLTASGFLRMQMFSKEATGVGDRNLTIDMKGLGPGGSASSDIVLTTGGSREEFEAKGLAVMKRETADYWNSRTSADMHHEGLNHLFGVSKTCLRASVGRSGKVDGGIWQYNLEWVRDQSMIAMALLMLGSDDEGESILRRILDRSVDESGGTVDSSRTRPPELMEIDQNGVLLHAIWTHWMWTGDDHLIRSYWPKMKKVADYVLQPVFRDPETGLLKNSREFWERHSGYGVREGYENTYQLFNIIGFEKIARMAAHLGESADSNRWMEASALMKRSFLSDPRFSLVDDGKFIKRRLTTGEVQRTFEPAARASMPQGMPLAVEKVSYADPDTSSVLPIVYGLVDGGSSLALRTLESMEVLWNQRWEGGGYGRYHVTSEPDSPGPWPFPTMFVARAYHEAGNSAKVWRALNWMTGVQGGRSGAWLEFYGERPVPPLPPVGFVVWTWAEIVMFIMHHFLGVRPQEGKLTLRPRLLDGIGASEARFSVHGRSVSLTVNRGAEKPHALLEGRPAELARGVLEMPYPERDVKVEMFIP